MAADPAENPRTSVFDEVGMKLKNQVYNKVDLFLKH